MTDDFQRDYRLEAHDDTASFDLGNDIEGWWVALRQIEEAWEDRSKRFETLHRFGIRDEQHFYQVSETVNRFVCGVRLDNAIATSPDAYHAIYRELDLRSQDDVQRLRTTAYRYAPHGAQRQRFGFDLGDISQLQMNALSKYEMSKMQARAQGELAGELGPVEGVTLEAWAGAQARAASGHDVNAIIGSLGIDRAKWDRVSAEWMARMSRDTTATIATAYGMAFTTAAQPAASANPSQPPIALEQYIEITEAMGAASQQGRDPNQVLARYGYTIVAWSNVGSWWSTHFSQNAMKNGGELHRKWSELSDFFRQKFSAPSVDGDLRF